MHADSWFGSGAGSVAPDQTPGWQSTIVVISWWSNCLGLRCLHRIMPVADGRPVYVVQVGKPAAQRRAFRDLMPRNVAEITYSDRAPAEHSRVIDHVARTVLTEAMGIWFVDHDTHLTGSAEAWWREADARLDRCAYCLVLVGADGGGAITAPAFWLSPARLPTATPSFDPIPFRTSPAALRPGRSYEPRSLRMPDVDTLVRARDWLAARGLVGRVAMDRDTARDRRPGCFPRHEHLGGLSLLAAPEPPLEAHPWMRQTVDGLNRFLASCPADWIAAEDPALLRRLARLTHGVRDGARA